MAIEQELREVEPGPTGPLSVFSPARWAQIQEKGYQWTDGGAVRSDGIVGVQGPGDPAYSRTVASKAMLQRQILSQRR